MATKTAHACVDGCTFRTAEGIADEGVAEILKHAPSTVPSTPAQNWDYVIRNFFAVLDQHQDELEEEAELLDLGELGLLYRPLNQIDPVKGLQALKEQSPHLDLSYLEGVDPVTLARATILMLSVSLER
jgi:hypothetical protein